VGHHRGVIARAQVVEHRHLVLEGDQPQPVVPTGGLLDLREQQGKVGLEVGQRAAHAAGVVDDEHDVQRAAGAGVDPGRGGRRAPPARSACRPCRGPAMLVAECRPRAGPVHTGSIASARLGYEALRYRWSRYLRGGCARCSGSSCGLTPSGCANKHYDPATHLGEIRSPAPDALCSGRGVVDVGAYANGRAGWTRARSVFFRETAVRQICRGQRAADAAMWTVLRGHPERVQIGPCHAALTDWAALTPPRSTYQSLARATQLTRLLADFGNGGLFYLCAPIGDGHRARR